MHERGAIAFSDDGVGVDDPSVMRKALQYCEDVRHGPHAALRGALASAAARCTRASSPPRSGLAGIPAEAEQLMIARDLLLNRTIGCRYHVQHISTAWSVELIRRAKRDGQTVTAEVSPHHLLLTDEMLPGVRHELQDEPAAAHRRGCAGVHRRRQGRHDRHASPPITPRIWPRKRNWNSPTPRSASSAWNARCRCTSKPWSSRANRLDEADRDDDDQRRRKIVKLDKGTLAEGADADVTIIDPNREWKIDVQAVRRQKPQLPVPRLGREGPRGGDDRRRRSEMAIEEADVIAFTSIDCVAGSIAQRLEQGTHNPLVLGSNPSAPNFDLHLAAAVPARYPVAQAHWKLNPPMRPSQSRISPAR